MLAATTVLASSTFAWAGPQVGTVAALQGEVKIFSNPSADHPSGPPPHAKFEGLYYSVRDAQIGDRLEKGNLLRTQVGAQARVIYDNGDQIYVAPASSYKIDWDHDAQDAQSANPVLDLRYGKARFVIQKGGPRSRFHIRTKTAVLGVRGTDFFVAVNDATDETEEATLRGEVEVRPPAEEAAPVSVKAGQTASIPKPPEAVAPGTAPPGPAPEEEVKLHATTQQELQAVQRNTVLQAPQPTPPAAAERMKALESAAAKTTLEDIRSADPASAQKLEQSGTGLDAINQATIEELAQKAPSSGAVGPIADASLEKPKEPEANKEEAKPEEPAPTLPGFWLGVKFGPHMANLDNNGSGNNGNYAFSTSNSPLSSPAIGVTAEYELGRYLSVIAELYPGNKHGETLQIYCGGPNCPNGVFSGQDTVTIKSFDLALGLKPQLPFGRSRVVALYGIFAADFSKITSAEVDQSPNGTQDISSELPGITTSIGGGAGIALRLWTHLKLSTEFRVTHEIGQLSGGSVPVGSAVQRLGSLMDVYGLLGAAYGF